MNRIRIKLIQQDLDVARRARLYSPRSTSCPIQQALRRRFPGAYITVGTLAANIDVENNGHPVRFNVGRAGENIIAIADSMADPSSLVGRVVVLTPDRYAL